MGFPRGSCDPTSWPVRCAFCAPGTVPCLGVCLVLADTREDGTAGAAAARQQRLRKAGDGAVTDSPSAPVLPKAKVRFSLRLPVHLGSLGLLVHADPSLAPRQVQQPSSGRFWSQGQDSKDTEGGSSYKRFRLEGTRQSHTVLQLT